MERVLVTGGRNYAAEQTVWNQLNKALAFYGEIIVIQGGADGADAIAKKWAASAGVCCLQVDAAWDKYGNSAGAVRNQWMLDFCAPTLVIAFPGGTGTGNMVKIAKRAGLPVYEIR